MREAVIVEAVRTPLGKRKGLLSNIRPDELAAIVLKEVVVRAGIDPGIVEDVIMGCVTQAYEQDMCIGRVAALIAGFPDHVPGTTVNRQCGSSQQALHFATQAILSGDMDIVIAAGVENMSRVPMGTSAMNVTFSKDLYRRYQIVPQGLAAEMAAEKWGYSREQMDAFSLESHQKACRAMEEGRFDREIVPVEVTLPDGSKTVLEHDEGPRKETSLEKLASLKPAFKPDGAVTAGNSSQISDGAAAILVMSGEKAKELGLKPRFTIHTRSVVGSDPVLTLNGPVPATKKALEKSGLTIADLDIYEINEAFAPAPMFWLQELNADPMKLNVNGGAIALGHPLGCSGVRLMVTMIHEMERCGYRYGLQSMCEFLGMANATIVERLT
ncbi:MAG: thiolase family protein [Bacillota bacterium]